MNLFKKLFSKIGTRKSKYVTPGLNDIPVAPVDPELAERDARRKQSETRLRGEGVPLNPELPEIETTSHVRLRTARETADRLLALTLVAMKAEGLDHDAIQEIIDVRNARHLFSPEERAFVENPTPSPEETATFSICYEAAWTLIWALRLVREPLTTPRRTCDNDRLIQIVRDTPDLAMYDLRDPGSVLDKLDLFCRYAWAVREALNHGMKPPADLNPQVALGRHWALRWLTRNDDTDIAA